jgi:hypothetical protein
VKGKGRQLFLILETWVDNNLTVRKIWRGCDVKGLRVMINGTTRLVVHVVSSSRFQPFLKSVYKA